MKTRSHTRREKELKQQKEIELKKKREPQRFKTLSVKYYNPRELIVVLDRLNFEKHRRRFFTSTNITIVRDPLNEKERIKRIKMSDHLRQVDKLKLDGNMSENWRRFKRSFDIFMNASGIIGKSESTKINTFLNAIGEDAVEVFDTFELTDAQKASYTETIKVFTDFCTPKKNQIYERFMFYQRHQKDGEPFDTFLMDLKQLVKSCEFTDKEQEMLRDQIVMGIHDKKLQRNLLEAADLTCAIAIQKCRASEATQQQQSTMSKTVTVNEVRSSNNNTQYRNSSHVDDRSTNNSSKQSNKNSKKNSFKGKRGNTQQQHAQPNRSQNNSNTNQNKSEKLINNCRFCSYSHKIRECPAFGKACGTCNKLNHFSSVCRLKNVDLIRASNNSSDYDFSDNEEFIIGTITSVNDVSNTYPWMETVVVENEGIPFKIDTGAEIDVIPANVLKRLDRRIELKGTGIKLRAFGGQKVKPIGMCILSCSFSGISLQSKFAVVDLDITPILGLNTCIKFGIVAPSECKQNRKNF